MSGGETTIDSTKASVARVYDALLGGKDNYEVDRVVYRSVLESDPQAPATAVAIREWLVRVVRWLAGPAGMDQFLDCGSGLPTQENTHEAAQRLNPEARVVYVDNDPVVGAHGRALLEENPFTHFVEADLVDPEALLRHPDVTRNLDLDRPYVLMQCNTLHHLMDDEDPLGIMRRYVDALPSGSYVALCHFWDPQDEDPESSTFAGDMEQRLTGSSMGSGRFRTRDEIAAYLEGLEPVEPGLVRLHEWWPDGPRLTPLTSMDRVLLSGVARKP
ncbi:SAM-dependent methyltransferase [Saccharomonospora halophila]|uniref:SAM-dependent methyltransferase n=1 Tax=Saccharomonospora halophila TaxID=129922 RepID=UPI00049151EE|nr:SAM-dependent methyltransferase [Saccharomonospora halophila]